MGANVVTGFILIASIWSVLCRINLMKHGKTKPGVFIQHAALAFGLACGLLLPAPYAKMAMGLGVLVFLLFGAERWKFGAPEGTSKPMNLEPLKFPHVFGGKK
jgi:hypothetical protein